VTEQGCFAAAERAGNQCDGSAGNHALQISSKSQAPTSSEAIVILSGVKDL